MNKDVFIYRVDKKDIIVGVSRSWEAFARANAWGSELRPEAENARSTMKKMNSKLIIFSTLKK